ncbi:MAG: protein kinase [Candidatus Competibacter sp.]|nr:protein kinase [Candidatus Competibacter sp.]
MQSGERIAINGRDYRLGSVLSTGAGNYGQVWAATDAAGRAVALKFINTEAMSQADPGLRGHWRAHLEREIVFLAGLDAGQSRHVVALFDHGLVDDQPVLVMERLAANLNQWLGQRRREGAPPPDLTRILDWTEQILDGLDVIHRAGFVYRDLKCSNILVGDDGALLKLADFGSLKREDGDSTRSFVGTPATMAPEQVLPARQDPNGCEYTVDYRADYYALGLLLFTLLTERPATDAQRRLGQLLALYGQEGASRHREQLGGLSDEERQLLRCSIEFWTVPVLTGPASGGVAASLTDLIDRLLAREPAGRPRNSAEIRVVLDAARAGQPTGPALAPESVVPAGVPNWDTLPPVVPPNRRQRRAGGSDRSPWSRRTVGLAGLFGLAGAVAWAIFQPSDPLRQDRAESPSAAIAPAPIPAAEPPAKPAGPASPAPEVAGQSPVPEPPAAPEAAPRADEATASTAPGSMAEPAHESIAGPRIESVADAPAPTVAPGETEPVLPPPEPDVPAVVATPSKTVTPASAKRAVLSRPAKPAGEKTIKASPPPVESGGKTVKAPPPPVESVTGPAPVAPPKAAPTVAKPALKGSAPASPEIARKAPNAEPPSAARPNKTSTRVVHVGRPPAATTHPSPTPSRPATASAGPVARVESRPPSAPPDLPPIKLESRPQPAPPDLPPIKLESRPQPAPPAPPIKLVSRSDPAPVMASVRPVAPPTVPARPPQAVSPAVSTPRRNPAFPSPPARSADPIDQFQEDAGRAATAIRREAEAVGNWLSHAGKEIQRGLDSANRAVNGWTGNCNQANGCGQSTRVERRDRWSDRHGAATPSRYAKTAPDDEDAGFAEPPPRRP